MDGRNTLTSKLLVIANKALEKENKNDVFSDVFP